MSLPSALPADLEIVDDDAGLVLRRLTVGVLATNCWIMISTTDRHAIVVDPGDEPTRIINAAHDASVDAVVLTHSHFDHVLALPTVTDHWGTPVHMHPADQPVWPAELDHLHRCGHFDAGTATQDLLADGETLHPPPDRPTWDGDTTGLHHRQTLHLGQLDIGVIHTPGHTPGGVSLTVPGHVLTGDTLFPGGPGLTGWPLSDFDTIIDAIRTRLLTLPEHTSIHPGHGPSTTVAIERPHLPEWINRGW